MSLIYISIRQIVIMAIMIAIGIICYCTHLVDHEQNKALSALTLRVVNPMVIFQSYQVELNPALLSGLLWAFLLSFISFLLSLVLMPILIRKKNNENYTVERLAAIYSNCGFIGIPLISAVLGDSGVFYLTAYLTLSSIFLWTHGYLSVSGESLNLKGLFHSLTTPCLVAVYLGMFFLLTGISLPPLVTEAVHSIGNMNTPLAMFVAGITIAQTQLGPALKNKRLYYVTLNRLIFIPVLILFSFIPFAKIGVDPIILITIIIASACPASATCTMFAVCYGKNERYSSELFAFTTLVSSLTIPFIVFLAEILL